MTIQFSAVDREGSVHPADGISKGSNDCYRRILAGSGRSGTTWLLDVLCQANGLRAMFEPLHPASWSEARPFAYRYIGKDEQWEELERFWSTVSAGGYSRIWSDYRVRTDRLKPSRHAFSSWTNFKRYSAHWRKLIGNRFVYGPQTRNRNSLIKVIRANLMVAWLAGNPLAKIAFVVRHPGAVVESQLRLRGDWNAEAIAAQYSGDVRLDKRLGVKWEQIYKTAGNDAELFTMIWCLENLVPMQDCRNIDNVQFLFYENLAMHDSGAWQQLLRSLNLDRAPDAELLTRPSQQASEGLDRKRIEQSQIGHSISRLSPADRASIQKILDIFGVRFYHIDSALPVASELISPPMNDWSQISSRST